MSGSHAQLTWTGSVRLRLPWIRLDVDVEVQADAQQPAWIVLPSDLSVGASSSHTAR
jgi:hypothetical protein